MYLLCQYVQGSYLVILQIAFLYIKLMVSFSFPQVVENVNLWHEIDFFYKSE